MKFKLERLQMSGRGPRVLWCIKNNVGTRQFPSGSGFSAWNLKRDAKRILDIVNEKGIEYVQTKLNKNKE